MLKFPHDFVKDFSLQILGVNKMRVQYINLDLGYFRDPMDIYKILEENNASFLDAKLLKVSQKLKLIFRSKQEKELAQLALVSSLEKKDN